MSLVSWQVGVYESGRSKNHISRDGVITLCGKKVPPQTRNTEVFFGPEGIGDCQGCQRVMDREAREYAEKYVNKAYLDAK